MVLGPVERTGKKTHIPKPAVNQRLGLAAEKALRQVGIKPRPEFIGKLAILQEFNLFDDLLRVSLLVSAIGDRFGLPNVRVKDLAAAGLIHDIGKTSPSGDPRVERAAAILFEIYDPLFVGGRFTPGSVQAAVVKLFSIRDRIDPNTKIKAVVAKYYEGPEAAEIGQALSFLGFQPASDPIGLFWRFHNFWSYTILKNRVSDRVLKLVAGHHLPEGVNPLDPALLKVKYDVPAARGYDFRQGVQATIADLKENDPALWEDILILIFADKIEAIMTRSGKNPADAVEIFYKIMGHSEYFEAAEFEKISRAFLELMGENPDLLAGIT